ncbi:MAG: hypothetical protein OXC37_06460 [Bdellovibrionaceae bacterium]|nr:hypothetical protein [Pseudobdellovibrionaceae bacterium]
MRKKIILIFVFGIFLACQDKTPSLISKGHADTSIDVFLNCDQLNALHYLTACCKYSSQQKAYIPKQESWFAKKLSGEAEYSRWQTKHIRGWYPPGVREHNLFIYVKKEDVPWINPNIKYKIQKCYNADWKQVNYYGMPLIPIPTGKAYVSAKISCSEAYSKPPKTCQESANNLPSKIFLNP